jgi:hypothetical protein
MQRQLFTFSVVMLICCAGCDSYTTTVCHVVDAANLQPIPGARVWEQPYAPIHPFWPRGDKGVTDANGEVKLSTPTSFYFYFDDVKADGYSRLSKDEGENLPYPADNSWIFYMKRDTPGGAVR